MKKTSPTAPAPRQRIGDGDVVAYRYLIRSETGQVLAASADVVRYIQGGQQAFPIALSSEFLGRHEGETFTVTLSRGKAFGQRGGPRQVTLPRDRFSDILTLQPGSRIDTVTQEGEQVSVWVVEARGQDVVVDFDHPLTGRPLQFEIAILSIRIGTDAERRAGRPDVASCEEVPSMADRGPTKIDLGKQLAELRRSLVEKFVAEERPGGLHDGLSASSYGRERQVRGLRKTHLALLDTLDGLAARVNEGEHDVDHRRALFALLARIARHDNAESALLQESFHTDVGGEG